MGWSPHFGEQIRKAILPFSFAIGCQQVVFDGAGDLFERAIADTDGDKQGKQPAPAPRNDAGDKQVEAIEGNA